MMTTTVVSQQPAPPSLIYALTEPGRFLCEINQLLLAHPFLRRAPRGDGHPVMVLPGFLGSDGSTAALRHYIGRWGYDVHGWELGRNLGLRASDPDFENRLAERLGTLVRRSGRRVSLVGWSLGGVLARELPRACPDHVRQVLTLGSPIGGDPRATTIWRIYEMTTETELGSDELRERIARMVQPVPDVPCTAIYSKSDGIVSHHIAREQPTPLTDNIRVIASHIGLGFSAAVMYAIADRLAQDEDQWQPFRNTSWRRIFYA
jgi:pimeloyl-ACP methyl ester carboxylesterase